MGLKMRGTRLGWRVVSGSKRTGAGQPVKPFSEEWPTRRWRTLLDEDDCGILRSGRPGCGGCGRLVLNEPVEE